MFKIIVKNSLGEVFAETREPLTAEELPGLLNIMLKPSMFGSREFDITVKRI